MFNVFLGFGGLSLFFTAFAWDGLVRHRMLIAPYPRGAAFGGQSLLLKFVRSILAGIVAALLALGCLLMASGSLSVVVQEDCHSTLSSRCLGTLVSGVSWYGWLWAGICLGWFVFVWLLLGNPYQRVLVYGVWYYQDKVSRLIQQALNAQNLPALPDETILALEEQTRQLMHRERWLVYDHKWLDGVRLDSIAPPSLEEMMQTALKKLPFQPSNPSEQAAISFLLNYFFTQARQAQNLSPLKRFLVGRLQFAKGGSYGGGSL